MKRKLFTIFQITILSAVLAITVFASNAGTEEDPVVTKSYVDKQIEEVINNVSSNKLSRSDMNKVIEGVADIIKEDNLSMPTVSEPLPPASYKAVELKTGKIIIGSEGTEIILRSGRAYSYITGIDTILDATTGQSLYDKNAIERNHIIIIPRADGRGIRATEDSWTLVRGEYSIQDYK